jgi:hypothetical protein
MAMDDSVVLPPLVTYGKNDPRARRMLVALKQGLSDAKIGDLLDLREAKYRTLFRMRKAHIPARGFSGKGQLLRDESIQVSWSLIEEDAEEAEAAEEPELEPEITPEPEPTVEIPAAAERSTDPVPSTQHWELHDQLQDKIKQLEESEEKRKQQQQQMQEIKTQLSDLEKASAENMRQLNECLAGSNLSYAKLQADPELQRRMPTFTPFTSFEAMDSFLDWLNTEGVAERLVMYRGPSSAKPPTPEGDRKKMNLNAGPQPQLKWRDQFLLTMCYLYSGLSEEGVAMVFGVHSTPTVSNTYTTWVLFLIKFFEQVFPVPTEDQIHSCYPKSVIDIWGNARAACLYDCTEFRMQSPVERVVSALMFSVYKHGHTGEYQRRSVVQCSAVQCSAVQCSVMCCDVM